MNPNAASVYRRVMVLKYLISYSYRNIPYQYLKEMSDSWTVVEKKNFENRLENERDEIISSMKGFHIWDYATNAEKEFISTLGSKPDEGSQLNANWRMEAAVVLLWALHLIDQLPDIDEQTDTQLLKLVEIKQPGAFSNDFSLRPVDEIMRMRSIMEIWHWRLNTRRLIENNYGFSPNESLKQSGVATLDDIVKLTARSAYSNGHIRKIMEEDFVFRDQPLRDLSIDDFNEATSIITERHYALNWLCGYAPENNWDETPTDT